MFSQAKISLEARTIRSTTQIRVVTRRQHRISALVPPTSFRAETSGRLRAVYHFSFRFSESNARGRERRAKRGRVTRVAICVSRVLLDGLQKKERLLVV